MKGAWPLLVVVALFGAVGLWFGYVAIMANDAKVAAVSFGLLAIAGAAVRAIREHVIEEKRRPPEPELPQAHVVAHPQHAAPPARHDRAEPAPLHAPIVVEREPSAPAAAPMREGNPDDKPKILT